MEKGFIPIVYIIVAGIVVIGISTFAINKNLNLLPDSKPATTQESDTGFGELLTEENKQKTSISQTTPTTTDQKKTTPDSKKQEKPLVPTEVQTPTPTPQSSSTQKSTLTSTPNIQVSLTPRCSGPDEFIYYHHLDVSMTETDLSEIPANQWVWVTLTDSVTNQTNYVSAHGGRVLNSSLTFHDFAGSLRGTKPLKLIADGRTYFVKAYLAPFTESTPNVGSPIYQTSFYYFCSFVQPPSATTSATPTATESAR